jgi:hypothetical protein
MDGLQVDHTATRDSSGRGYSQVIDFEHHRASFGHLDALTIVKTQHLVVIKHSVHVLNPESIDGAVKANPAFPVSFLRFEGLHSLLHKVRNNTFGPLVGKLVHFTVQFAH